MIPLVKSIKRRFTVKELSIVLLALLLSVAAGIGVFFVLKKDVIISENGVDLHVRTMVSTVGDVLKQNRINLTPDDYISIPLDSRLYGFTKNKISIKRAVPVNILADGMEYRVMTYKDTIADAIEKSPVILSENDRLEGAKLTDKVVSGMTVRVIRVKNELVTEKTPLPYTMQTRENPRLDKGTQRTLKEGSEGVREKQYLVTYEDGKEISRSLLKEYTAVEPVNGIIEVGTILNHKTARGDVIRYSKVLDMRATAYTASFKDTGKNPGDPGFGITYTGVKARKGIIAVDPKVIPLGTRVYVEVAGSTPDYGYAVAGDIGGAIKGNLIDLYYDDQEFVDRWGVKKVKVYFITD